VPEKLTIQQVRAARKLLSWTQQDLADTAKVSVTTIKRLEASDEALRGRGPSPAAVKRAFEQAGVEFHQGAPWVALKARKAGWSV
jgi:transcriptional regulator with XRE-family HTH domain